MNAEAKATLTKALWVVTGVTALCVGLGALNVNVLGTLHLDGLENVLRYFVGLAGLASLVMFFKKCSEGKC
jgi:uncharacterized membrane protein YuzA (DUF378 family)